MTRSLDLTMIAGLSRRLPQADLTRLSAALTDGQNGLHRLRSTAGSDVLRAACTELTSAIELGTDPRLLAGALLGAAATAVQLRDEFRVDVVWTGTNSSVTTSRLTSEAIAAVLAEARTEILLIGYAVHSEPRVTTALHAAADRGIDITLLLERSVDNAHYSGAGQAFPGLRARRLAWPAESRPTGGAALHAKVLVVDRAIALVGSANVTGWALERNLKCGILLRGGPEPQAIQAHIDAMHAAGDLHIA